MKSTKRRKARTGKHEMRKIAERLVAMDARRIRRKTNMHAIRRQKKRVSIATKTGELNPSPPGKGKFRGGERRKRRREKIRADRRAPRREKRAKNKTRGWTEARKGIRGRERGTFLRCGVGHFIPFDTAVRWDPNKGKRDRGRKEMNERPNREESRAEKDRRTRAKGRKKRERIREERGRRE